MGYINYGLIPGGDQNCCEKWLKPFLKYIPFHSPWFKPWAMKKRKHDNRFNGFKNQRL